MARVLLLLPTTTYRTHAFMEAARRLGVEVTVGSEEPSTLAGINPTGLLTLDFNDLDQSARCVVEFAARYPIDAVVPVDDQVTVVGTAIGQALGLSCNSVESAAAARNKYHMRELLSRASVPQPDYQLASLADDPVRLAREVRYPCVVKPLTLSASRGVIRANDEREFVQVVARLDAILKATRREADKTSDGDATARQFLAEEFVPGEEVALEGLLSRGELRVLALFDKPDPLDGPFFEETIYVTPSRLPVAIQEEIVRCTARACAALGLSEGPVHAELRLDLRSHPIRSVEVNQDPSSAAATTARVLAGGPWIIEVNPRSIGGLCSRVLCFGTGLSLEELIIRHALDRDYIPPAREDQAAGVLMIPIPRAGILKEVNGLAEASCVPGIEQVVISARLGQNLVPLPEGSLYLGFIFARAESPQAVETALRAAHARMEFLIGPQEKNVVSGDHRPRRTPTTQVHNKRERA